MPIAFLNAPYTLGNRMQWTQLAADFVAGRDYVNAVDTADVDAACIRREHLVRPFITGFPRNSFESDFQGAFWRSFGTEEATALLSAEWGARRNRLTFLPKVNDGVRSRWYLPLGFSFSVSRVSYLEASFTFELQNRGPLSGAGGPVYPDGAGAGDVGGYLRLATFERSTAIERFFLSSDQQLYPNETAAGTNLHHDRGMVWMSDTINAGEWDVYVVYDRDNAPADLEQYDLSRCYLSGEVF